MSNLSKTPNPDSGPRPGKSKLKIVLAVVAVVAIAAAVAFMAIKSSVGARAWETFSAAMDKTAGQGNWSAGEHEFAFLSRTLTVKGLALNFPAPPAAPPEVPPDAAGAAPAPSPASSNRREGTFVRLDTLKIQGTPDRDVLERLMGDGVLPAGPGRDLFELVSIDGLTGEKTRQGLTTEYGFTKLELSGLGLKEIPRETEVGSPDFLKAVVLKKAELSGYHTGFAAPAETGEDFSLSLGSLSLEAPGLGDGFGNPDNYYDYLRNVSAASASLAGFKTSVSQGGVAAFTGEAGKLDLKGLTAGGSANSFSGSGIRVEMKDPATPDFTAVVALAEFELARPDLTVPLARAGDVADRLATKYYFPSVSRIWQEFPRISDIVSFPFGMERGTIRGLSGAVEPGPSLKVAEGLLTGPITAQTLPKGALELKGVVYTPPPDPQSLSEGNLKTLTMLLPYLGQDVLELNAKLAFASDPGTGEYRLTLNELSAKGAGELTGSVSLEGIRSELMDPLSRIYLSDLPRLSFGRDLSKVGLQRLQLNYTDRGFIPAAYSYLAEQTNQEAGAVREAVTTNVTNMIRDRMGPEIEDIEPVLSEIGGFLAAPGTLSASSAPSPPLNHEVYESIPEGDQAAWRNAMNISVTVNGAAPTPLRFRNPPVAAPAANAAPTPVPDAAEEVFEDDGAAYDETDGDEGDAAEADPED
ncbi:MAG: hypothetical protein LBR80_18240 [Deltaproteobacteria bacterium]|jgi:hypothetical protein|nr:hypothetical protein [Deltaproteobacteria bacterium]